MKYPSCALKILTLALAFQCIASAQAQSLLITLTNTYWKYLADGTDQQTAWRDRLFDDSAWPSGRGLFGDDTNVAGYLAVGGFATTVHGTSDTPPGPQTAYYRTHFNWFGSIDGVILVTTNYVDDGFVMYLNGTEILRHLISSDPVTFFTGSDVTAAIAEGNAVLRAIALDTNLLGNPLQVGDNVLAVEVHQTPSASSDHVWGMSLSARTCHPPCTDGIQPTNRTILEGRSTTFVVSQNCGIPVPTFQWYRNIGLGEELIPGATDNTYTLTNAMDGIDEGVYYCRMTSACGSVDSRQATLFVDHVDGGPVFLSASVIGSNSNKFRLTTDRELCMNLNTCGTDFRDKFNWQILQADNPSMDLGVVTVTQVNATTYEFTTANPRNPSKLYQITVISVWGAIGDLFGNLVPPGTFAETPPTFTFQQGGGNGYAGTQDAEIHSSAFADTPLGTLPQMKCDLDDAGAGIAQSLLRFDSIIGFSTNQIPPGSRIRSATLTIYQVDPGAAVNLHRMLITWDQTTATWNSLNNGVIADDVEARVVADTTTPAGLANGPVELDVTASVQAWADGQPNHGWALLSTGLDAWIVNTSESGASTAPLLTVEFEHVDECVPVITGQPPPTLVALEGQPLSISVSVLNPFDLVFQWTKDSVDIPGATGMNYSIQNARLSDSGTYRLRISCGSDPATSVISGPSLVIVRPDDTRAYLTGAAARLDGTTVTLHFSKPLNEASARNLANYVFTPALAVIDAALTNRTSSAIVTLTTAARELSNYVLRIANLLDTSSGGNLIFPNPTFVTLTTAKVILPWDADNWIYNTNNLDPTPEWKNPEFTPGPDWRTGRGLFGTEVRLDPLIPWLEFIATPLIPNNVLAESELRVTAYFRKTIDLPALPAGARYVICHYADDGFIAYLDGAEIHRFAMSDGAVTFTNRSTGIPTRDATHRSFTFNATPGIHTLAVELHQAGVISSDVLFGMEVRLVAGTSPSLSIARSVNGDVNLNWNADNNWRLRSAAALSGPYLDVAIPVGSRLGTFRLPSTSVTNRSFWLLDYITGP